MAKAKPIRLFISHSHADNEFGVRLAEDLRRALGDEQSVWYDVSGGLHGGDAWWRKIVQEIDARPVFLVVLSPDAMESRWVNDEIDLAWNLKNTAAGKTIIPVLYRECAPRADLRTRHIISFLPPRPYDAALAETLAALGVRDPNANTTAPTAATTAAPAAPAAPASPAPLAHGDLIAQFAPQIAAAYERRDWPDVTRKAEFLIRRAPEQAPAPIYRMLGVALLEEGAAERARETLDTALALNPLDLDTLRAKARAALALGEPALAHTLLDDALALAPDDALRLRLLADDAYALRQAGEGAAEVRRCDEALRLAPGASDWQGQRIVALTLAGRLADAQAEMDQLARGALARASADSGQAQRAEARALQQELTLEAHVFRRSDSDEEQRACAERFAALLARNAPHGAAQGDLRDDPLSPQREAAPRLPERLATLGYIIRPFGEVEAILPPLCAVAAGRCLLSDGAGWEPGVAARDLPHQWVTLAAFEIARYPVTVAEYACFARVRRREPLRWVNGDQRLDWQTQLQRPDHPVVCVTWHDALAYAAWLRDLTGRRWRLPTEAEWEKAARWDEATKTTRAYPWGERFDPACCNCATAIGQTTPVGSYPDGACPCGALDLAGNVWEWTSNLSDDSAATESRPNADPTEIAVLRGGSWVSGPSEVSGVARRAHLPYGYSSAIGFRLVCSES